MSKTLICAPSVYVIENYADLVNACRRRRMALSISQLALDDKAGLPDGYTGKVEISASNRNAKNARSIGRDSLPLILGALGAQLVLVPKGSVELRAPVPPGEAGKRGGTARAKNMTPEQRREAGRKAVRARWDRVKAPPGSLALDSFDRRT